MDSEGKLRSQAELAAEILAARAKEKRRVVATAESLTGGLVSELITGVAGSSAWFDRGFVTYQPEAKVEMIDVPAEMIRTEGVVSEPVAEAMARGALASSKADLSVALTG
ncbi:MAG: CinA family protein, partial [Sutterella wadsworthensis]|nr:CinA family protein [Sutterella wadsworthensis]